MEPCCAVARDRCFGPPLVITVYRCVAQMKDLTEADGFSEMQKIDKVFFEGT